MLGLKDQNDQGEVDLLQVALMFGDVDVMSTVLEYVDEPFNVKCKELFVEKFCRYRAHEIFAKDTWRNPDAIERKATNRRISTDDQSQPELGRNATMVLHRALGPNTVNVLAAIASGYVRHAGRTQDRLRSLGRCLLAACCPLSLWWFDPRCARVTT